MCISWLWPCSSHKATRERRSKVCAPLFTSRANNAPACVFTTSQANNAPDAKFVSISWLCWPCSCSHKATRERRSNLCAPLFTTSRANNAPACRCKNAAAYFHRTPASSHRTAAGREISTPPSPSSSPFLQQYRQHQRDESG